MAAFGRMVKWGLPIGILYVHFHATPQQLADCIRMATLGRMVKRVAPIGILHIHFRACPQQYFHRLCLASCSRMIERRPRGNVQIQIQVFAHVRTTLVTQGLNHPPLAMFDRAVKWGPGPEWSFGIDAFRERRLDVPKGVFFTLLDDRQIQCIQFFFHATCLLRFLCCAMKPG